MESKCIEKCHSHKSLAKYSNAKITLINMSNYSYPVQRFNRAERLFFRNKLQQHPWNKVAIIGPPNSKKHCIVTSGKLISNPFWRRKGPRKLKPYQAAFIVIRGYLPLNQPNSRNDDRFEMSHICGNKNCINVSGRHIKVERHKLNMKRISHHKLLIGRRKVEMRDRRRRKRITGSERGCSSITTMTCKQSECDCRPRCFKNFVIAS